MYKQIKFLYCYFDFDVDEIKNMNNKVIFFHFYSGTMKILESENTQGFEPIKRRRRTK